MRARPWWKVWQGRSEQKSIARTLLLQSHATWSQRRFIDLCNDGYRMNATVRACIDAIVKAALECNIVVRMPDDTIVYEHDIIKRLSKPNPAQDWDEFLSQALGYRLIAGESPVWANVVTRTAGELWVLRPDFLEPEVGSGAIVQNWVYTPNDPNSGAPVSGMKIPKEDLLLWKAFNPIDRRRGLSPLWSAAFAVDTLNAYAQSNKALLDNAAQPSGVLSSDNNMDDATFERLKAQVEDNYQGARNAGKPMLLEGGLKWMPTGITPRDMEFIAGKRVNEQDVCKVLGVPAQVIGLDGSMTFANYEQARAAMYEDNVIPLMNSLLSGITRWLGPRMGLKEGAMLAVDVEAIPALEPRRAERNKSLDTMQSLTTNEKRAAMGYDEAPGGDVVLVGSGLMPLDTVGLDEFADPLNTAADAYGTDTKPVAPKPVEAEPVASDAPTDDVQKQALNGAQMASLQAIVQSVANGELPAESAIQLIMVSIPGINDAAARAMVSPAETFNANKPAPPPQLAPFTGQPPKQEEQDGDQVQPQ